MKSFHELSLFLLAPTSMSRFWTDVPVTERQDEVQLTHLQVLSTGSWHRYERSVRTQKKELLALLLGAFGRYERNISGIASLSQNMRVVARTSTPTLVQRPAFLPEGTSFLLPRGRWCAWGRWIKQPRRRIFDSTKHLVCSNIRVVPQFISMPWATS